METVRSLPHDLTAEQAVIGCMLMDNNEIHRVVDTIKPQHFYLKKHRTIFEVMVEMFNKDQTVDLVTLSSRLEALGMLEQIGGSGYIADCFNHVVSARRSVEYAKSIKEAFKRVALIRLSQVAIEDAYDYTKDIDETFDKSQQRLITTAVDSTRRGFAPLTTTLDELHDKMVAADSGEVAAVGVPTGFGRIDSHLNGGLHPGGLYILAARPSVGKTAFSLAVAHKVAVNLKLPTAFFSLESTAAELGERLLSIDSDVDSWAIRNHAMSDKQREQLSTTYGNLAEGKLYVDDTSALSIAQIRSRARRLNHEDGPLKLIIVDYLQLARSRNLENRVQEVAEVSQGLKALAKDLSVPVLALSQLSRGVEARSNRQPQLSDLRDSGSIEQDADAVLFLWRDSDSVSERSMTDKIPVMCTIAKNRNGRVGEVQLVFHSSRTKMVEAFSTADEKLDETKKEAVSEGYKGSDQVGMGLLS